MPLLSSNLKAGLILGIAALFLAVMVIFFGDNENPLEKTRARLRVLEQAIVSFTEENKRAPESLADLNLPEEVLQDHLGEPFLYSRTGETAQVLSYGSDKKPGGLFLKRDHKVTVELPPME